MKINFSVMYNLSFEAISVFSSTFFIRYILKIEQQNDIMMIIFTSEMLLSITLKPLISKQLS